MCWPLGRWRVVMDSGTSRPCVLAQTVFAALCVHDTWRCVLPNSRRFLACFTPEPRVARLMEDLQWQSDRMLVLRVLGQTVFALH